MTPTKASYNDTPIAPTSNHLTTEQKLDLLDWHPIFTGRCPNCEMPIRETVPPRGHWGCRELWVEGGAGVMVNPVETNLFTKDFIE